MNKEKQYITKKPYCQPSIFRIELDSQISLALQSVPEGDPIFTQSSENFVSDPFKLDKA